LTATSRSLFMPAPVPAGTSYRFVPSTAIWTLKSLPFRQRKFAPQWSASCAVNMTTGLLRRYKGSTRRSADTYMQDTRI
jgi:hypothetical protein